MSGFVPANSFPDLGGDVAIIAGGESARGLDFDRLRGLCPVIAVNGAAGAIRWADFAFTADSTNLETRFALPWFSALPWYSGRKVAAIDRVIDGVDIIFIRRTNPSSEAPADMIRGGNSGLAAYEWAVKNGARRVFLFGCDCVNWSSHWHDPPGVEEGGRMNYLKGMTLRRWNSWPDPPETYNVSPISLIERFPKISFDDAVRMLGG